MKRMIWPVLAILIFIACDSNRLSEENIDFPKRVWSAKDIKRFDLSIADTELSYNLFFNVRNTSDYPHYNLYVQFVLENSRGIKLNSELINIELFDPKTGFPYGKSGLGDLFEHQENILENFTFPDSGHYVLSFQQFMRYDSLPEIASVGFRIEKVPEGEGI